MINDNTVVSDPSHIDIFAFCLLLRALMNLGSPIRTEIAPSPRHQAKVMHSQCVAITRGCLIA
jgi:hypothetical protein